MSKHLAKFFKEKRMNSGLSQAEVAKKLGYKSAQYVSNWERGECLPPTKSLGKIAEFYGIPKKEILNILLSDYEAHLRKHL